MGHSSVPRDSCGGTKRCGGNFLVADAVQERDSAVDRNKRALNSLWTSFRSVRKLKAR
jgi:hypothetical protein